MRLFGVCAALFPLVLIAVGTILLNDGCAPGKCPGVQTAADRHFFLSVLGIISAIGGWLSESGQNAERRIQTDAGR
ncbi:MAG: hypothetical protein IPK76_22015 [Lewinellaceae bacterium]|nr:hypothetical protein [Lewinellaceae bacterium]